MGSSNSINTEKIQTNRFPILTPKHFPKNMNYSGTVYNKFDSRKYEENFEYPLKEPAKYW